MARRKAASHPPKLQTKTAPAPARNWDRTAHIALVCIFLIGAWLRISNLDVVRRSPDELTYTVQAKAVVAGGVAGAREVVQAFLHTPSMWLYPPPNRIGYLNLLALAMKLSGSQDPQSGSWLSCLASMATLGVAIAMGLRFFGTWPAVLGALFLAFFPPELVTARRCWSDALVTLSGAGMLYFTLAIWNGAKRWKSYLWLPLIGSAAVLIKETTVVLYASCLVVALWAARRDWKNAGVLLGAAAGGALAAAGLLALYTGSFAVPIEIITGQAKHNAANAYAIEYCSGPGYLLLQAFETMSPLVIVLAVAGLLAAVAWRPFREHRLLAWLTIGNLAIYMIVPHWLNLRYASATFVPLCLFAGMAAYWLLARARERVPGDLALGVVAVGVGIAMILLIADYQRFENEFVRQPNNVDLSVKMVLDATE
jgi:hypothetical protein